MRSAMTGSAQDGTRQKLLRAAIKVFAAQGYKGATVRDICAAAGAGNVSSINYHFGSKEDLYKEILELIFSEFEKQKRSLPALRWKEGSPEERLKQFIQAYCRMLYRGVEVDENMRSIFMAEMSRPSPFLDQMAQKYMIPQAGDLMDILTGMLGPDTRAQVLLDCAVSIVGAIGYYSVAWPLLTRIFPHLPDMRQYADDLAAHVYSFSMAGLKAVRRETVSTRKKTKLTRKNSITKREGKHT